MKKLILNRIEYSIDNTNVSCKDGSILVGDRFVVEIPENKDVYLETGADHVRIEISA